MRVVWRRSPHCGEGNSAYGAAILASILAGVIGLAEVRNSPTYAAEECLTKPGKQAPPGRHWYYTTDRTTKRRCWFLGRAGDKGRRAAAKRSRALKAGIAPEQVPLPPPRAMARDVSADAAGEPKLLPQDEAKAIPQSEPAMGPPGGEPVSTTGEGSDDRWRTTSPITSSNESSQVWPVSAASEPAAANHPPPGNSEPSAADRLLPSNSEPLPTDERTVDAQKMNFAREPPLALRVVVDSEKPTASRNTFGFVDLFAMLVLTLCVGGALLAVVVLRRPAYAWGASRKDPDQTAEYVSSLSRLVAGLNPDDVEAHRAAYDRARQALIDGLHEFDPPLPKATIAVEQSAFEAAVRRIEAKRRRPAAVFLRLIKRAGLRTGLDAVGARLTAWTGEGGNRWGMSFSRRRA